MHVHAPFWFGAIAVAVGVVILLAGARTVTRALTSGHEDVSEQVEVEEEAEAVLVGDLD